MPDRRRGLGCQSTLRLRPVACLNFPRALNAGAVVGVDPTKRPCIHPADQVAKVHLSASDRTVCGRGGNVRHAFGQSSEIQPRATDDDRALIFAFQQRRNLSQPVTGGIGPDHKAM